MLLFDRGSDIDPVAILVGLQAVALGDDADELDVVFAAGHHEAAGAVDARELLRVAHDELHVDLFAIPAVGMVHRVDVPHAVVVVGNVDEVGRHVERALVAGQVVLAVAVVVLKVDVRAAVDHAQIARAQALFELVVAAVEDDHVRVRDLFHHELTHVLDEQLERRRLHEGHDLVEHPVGGQHLAVELFHLPHAIVLNEHLLGAVLLFKLLAESERQLLFVVYRDNGDVVERLLLVFFVALFTADQKRPVLAGEAVF